VWTNVGDAHIGHFGSRAAIADAKAEILDGATTNTVVISSADDPLIAERVRRSTARRVTFGRSADATVRATDIDNRGFDGTTATVATPAGRLRLAVSLAGEAQLMNVLAAVAVALEFRVPPGDIEPIVRDFAPIARRGAVHRLRDGARLVDDSYNASPAAVQAMLAALAATPTAGRRIAVLGEMLELGAASRALHEQCGRAAAAAVQQLVVVGGDAADGLIEGARAGGLAADRIHRFADGASAASAVRSMVGPGDLVLVKASRGTRLDTVADRLMEDA
jgi:UDP-N-acetylmuramoyl-tripeptide--D-alanyl-D-alanine ligase